MILEQPIRKSTDSHGGAESFNDDNHILIETDENRLEENDEKMTHEVWNMFILLCSSMIGALQTCWTNL
eukprot:UN34565